MPLDQSIHSSLCCLWISLFTAACAASGQAYSQQPVLPPAISTVFYSSLCCLWTCLYYISLCCLWIGWARFTLKKFASKRNKVKYGSVSHVFRLFTWKSLFYFFASFRPFSLPIFRFASVKLFSLRSETKSKPVFHFKRKQFFYIDTYIQAGTHRYARTSIYL